MMKSILLGTAVLLLFSLLSLPAGAAGGLIPMEDFFRNPDRSGFQISPDGTRISWRESWERRMNIFVQEIGEETATRITSATERDILAYFWAGNDRILYLQDSGGDENYHLYGVDAGGSERGTSLPSRESGFPSWTASRT